MATRFMYKALSTAALGIALSLTLTAPTTASPAASRPAAELQLDVPAAPSSCTSRTRYSRRWRETSVIATWRDNSINEDGFLLEWWVQNPSGAWVLAGSQYLAANSTTGGTYYEGRDGPHYRFRVRAFNASGDSAWSNWSH